MFDKKIFLFRTGPTREQAEHYFGNHYNHLHRRYDLRKQAEYVKHRPKCQLNSLHDMIVQIYEIQTPFEAEKLIGLGVDHIGSVVDSEKYWKSASIRETIHLTQSAGFQSSLILLFSNLDSILRALDYYQPNIAHFCEALTRHNGIRTSCFELMDLQKKVKERFVKSIKNNRLAHAYLFYGLEGCGKEAFAFELAKAVNCDNENENPCNTCASCQKISQFNHPDIKFIFPTVKSWNEEDIRKRIHQKGQNVYSKINLSGHTVIQIDRIRELQKEAKYSPYEAKKKVYIITNAEQMTREGANSFLKLLEEPPDSLMIILITSSLKALFWLLPPVLH